MSLSDESEDPSQFTIKNLSKTSARLLDGIARDRDIPQTGDNRRIATLPVIVWEDQKASSAASPMTWPYLFENG